MRRGGEPFNFVNTLHPAFFNGAAELGFPASPPLGSALPLSSSLGHAAQLDAQAEAEEEQGLRETVEERDHGDFHDLPGQSPLGTPAESVDLNLDQEERGEAALLAPSPHRLPLQPLPPPRARPPTQVRHAAVAHAPEEHQIRQNGTLHEGQVHVGAPHKHHSEPYRILRLAAPLSISNVGGYCIGIAAMVAVGHLGEAALSVVVLSTSVYNMTGLAALVGFASAMETFCGQAYGAGRYRLLGLVLQRALLVLSLQVGLVALVWLHAERLLLALGQDPRISHGTAQFLIRATPALWFTAVFEALKRYLMAQEVVRPITAATVAALLLSPFYNWFLIYHLGLGLHGAAYAMVAVQATTACFLVAYCAMRDYRLRANSRSTWGGWSWKAFSGWGQYLRLALPSVAMMCCEWAMFQVMVVMSGWLPQPDVSVSVMGICINTSGLVYMAVTGFACAASVRVGNSLGAGHPQAAKRATWAAWALTMCMEACFVTAIILGRHQWARVFTNSLPVIQGTAVLLPILSISIVGDGTSAVLQGLLRGGGKQAVGAITNVCSYWGCGVPLAYYLAFHRGMGLRGLWWGLACTNAMQGCIMATIAAFFDFPREAEKAAARTREQAALAEAKRALQAADDVLSEPLLA